MGKNEQLGGEAQVIFGSELERIGYGEYQRRAGKVGGKILTLTGLEPPASELFVNRQAFTEMVLRNAHVHRRDPALQTWGTLIREARIAYDQGQDSPEGDELTDIKRIYPIRIVWVNEDSETVATSSRTLLSLTSVEEAMDAGILERFRYVDNRKIYFLERALDFIKNVPY